MAGSKRRSEKREKSPRPISEADEQAPRPEAIGDPPQPDARQPQRTAPNREEIERRAYDLYMRRGGRDGADLDDWLAAEQDLRSA